MFTKFGFDSNKDYHWTILVLALIVITALIGHFLSANTTEVYYSLATGQAIRMEVNGEVIPVTPSTEIPSRHERVWVP